VVDENAEKRQSAEKIEAQIAVAWRFARRDLPRRAFRSCKRIERRCWSVQAHTTGLRSRSAYSGADREGVAVAERVVLF
jgi:hypothetical protein